jgi:hypothetical protein
MTSILCHFGCIALLNRMKGMNNERGKKVLLIVAKKSDFLSVCQQLCTLQGKLTLCYFQLSLVTCRQNNPTKVF